MRFLTGNAFPLGLIKRNVTIEVCSLAEYIEALSTAEWKSFWGHNNTLNVVNQLTGFDLTPEVERPVLTVNEEGFLMLAGEEYKLCYILSPNYIGEVRPKIGEEVSSSMIKDWQVLKMKF